MDDVCQCWICQLARGERHRNPSAEHARDLRKASGRKTTVSHKIAKRRYARASRQWARQGAKARGTRRLAKRLTDVISWD